MTQHIHSKIYVSVEYMIKYTQGIHAKIEYMIQHINSIIHVMIQEMNL